MEDTNVNQEVKSLLIMTKLMPRIVQFTYSKIETMMVHIFALTVTCNLNDDSEQMNPIGQSINHENVLQWRKIC